MDTDGNRSLVSVWLNLVVAGSVWGTNMVCGVTGHDEWVGTRTFNSGTYTLASNQIWVKHNDDGSGTAALSWWTTGAGDYSGKGALTLTKINRYPKLNSGCDFTDRTNPVYDITAYGVYPIRVKVEAGGNPQLITRDLVSKDSQVYTLELTDAERNALRSLMSGDTLAVKETVCAMNGNTELSADVKNYTMTKGPSGARIRVNGEWKEAVPYIAVNSQWKEADAYIRVNGEWKEGI